MNRTQRILAGTIVVAAIFAGARAWDASAAGAGVTSLAWSAVPQSGAGGPTFPTHFKASVPGGFVLASVLTRSAGAGAGLLFVPQSVSSLAWQSLPQSGAGGATFPVLFRAAVGGGTLILAVLNRADGDGVGLAFVPAPVASVAWQSLPQSGAGGPSFPVAFRASIAGGTLIVSVLNRARGDGVGLVFVPGVAVTQVAWASLPQSGAGGPSFPKHFAAPAGAGSLVLGVLNRTDGDGVSLTFAPQRVLSLTFASVPQSGAGGPSFPVHFASPGGGGTLLASVLTRADGDGADITFVP